MSGHSSVPGGLVAVKFQSPILNQTYTNDAGGCVRLALCTEWSTRRCDAFVASALPYSSLFLLDNN